MSRRKKSVKRPILPDARYDSQTVSKFINAIMYQGKKSTAERIFYDAMDLVESRTSQSGVTVFKQALTNLKPAVVLPTRSRSRCVQTAVPRSPCAGSSLSPALAVRSRWPRSSPPK